MQELNDRKIAVVLWLVMLIVFALFVCSFMGT